MKIVCHREALLNGVSIASSVAPSRSTREILSGVKLTAGPDGTVALATDLDIAVCSRLKEVIVEEAGDVVLTAQVLVEILRSIEADQVTITSEGRYCEIRSADAEYKLVTDDPEEFPEISVLVEGGVNVPRVFLEELFSRTAFAAARDIGRYAINGVLVELVEGKIRFVATDGRRLAVAERMLPDAPAVGTRAIVPVKALHECLRGSEGCASVRLIVEEQRVMFSSENADVTAKPVEGEFPDYGAVVPTEYKGRVVMPRDVIFSAVRKVSVMSGEDMRAIQLSITDGKVSIEARVEGRGEAKTEFEIETEGETGFKVDFNPDFLVDFLKPLSAKSISFEFRDSNGAGVFRVAETNDLYVVMPITTN